MWFRFHTGSIKSSSISRCRVNPRTGFDSILVRLKAHTPILNSEHRSCFDSILVRLKVSYRGRGIRCVGAFRFHTGSIKRTAAANQASAAGAFRFHTGSIKSGTAIHNISESIKVSIPYWFD